MSYEYVYRLIYSPNRNSKVTNAGVIVPEMDKVRNPGGMSENSHDGSHIFCHRFTCYVFFLFKNDLDD